MLNPLPLDDTVGSRSLALSACFGVLVGAGSGVLLEKRQPGQNLDSWFTVGDNQRVGSFSRSTEANKLFTAQHRMTVASNGNGG